MLIKPYEEKDREELITIFTKEVDNTYISHGEMQMGLSKDGSSFVENFNDLWVKYLDRQSKKDNVFIDVCRDDEGLIAGFIIFGIDDDFNEEYGILYDFFVRIKDRGTGLAKEILKSALSKLYSRNISDIYFESGANCHRAHNFYKRMGAKHISNVYKISIFQYMNDIISKEAL